MSLPDGFRVRIRDDVEIHDGGRVLVGGSPLRAMRLSPVAQGLVENEELHGRTLHTVRVSGSASSSLARRLLDANMADPLFVGSGPVSGAELTVVIPVRDRADQLDRVLTSVHSPVPGDRAPADLRLRCIVVDDASRDPDRIREVTQAHGVELVPLTTNVGPAGARNAGLELVTTPYVAFVDSDVTVTPRVLLELTRHFADPAVVLVGPQIRGVSRSIRPKWFERYDTKRSSLTLGERACSVRSGAAVGWLPSACLVARVGSLGHGFTASMRIGEDVDLVWRLVSEGHSVRYDPSQTACHDARSTLRGWLGRKFLYGTGGAPLARRHGADHTAPAAMSPVMAIAAAGVLLRCRWALPAAVATTMWSARALRGKLPDVPQRDALSARLAIRGLGWALRQESALVLRHWAPPLFLAALASRRGRQLLGSALLIDAAVVLATGTDDLDVGTVLLARRLDDLAYGAGLWAGALRAASLDCLKIRWTATTPR